VKSPPLRHTTFPDMQIQIEVLIAEGTRRWGLLRRTPPTSASSGHRPDRQAGTINTIDVIRIAGGKIVEHWLQGDFVGLLQQLGAVPAPGRRTPRRTREPVDSASSARGL
jgi:predicted ester cyclase